MDVGSSLIGGALFALMLGAWGWQWTRGRRAHAAWKQGLEALQRNDFAAAEKTFRRCVKAAPTSATARRMLGRALFMTGKHEEAEKTLRFGADLEPRNPEGFIELAIFYMARPAPDEAKALDALESAWPHAPRLLDELSQIPPLAPLREAFKARIDATGDQKS